MFCMSDKCIEQRYGLCYAAAKLRDATEQLPLIDIGDSARNPPLSVQKAQKRLRPMPRIFTALETKRGSKKRGIVLDTSSRRKVHLRKPPSRTDSQARPPQSSVDGSKKWRRGQEFRISAHENLSGSATERGDTDPSSSDDDGPGYPQPGSQFQESPAPHLRYALKWFRLVQRMVFKEGMDDYELSYYSPSQSILYMVIQGWIDLSEVIAWRHARAELGRALVDNINYRGGFMWMSKSNGVTDTQVPLTEDEEALFRNPWQVCTDPKMQYDWRKDRAERRKHGPFGERVAKYVTPAIQEKVLEVLLKPEVDIEDLDLPGNWKPLFGPLFRRKRADLTQPGPSSDSETKRKGESDSESKGPSSSQNDEEDRDRKRKYHSTLDDANEGDNGARAGNDNKDDYDSDNDSSRGGKRRKLGKEGKWEANIPEDASNPTSSYAPSTMGIHEPLPYAEVFSASGSLEGCLDASDSVMVGIEQTASPVHQTWIAPGVVANQFSIPENGANVDHFDDTNLEGIVSNSQRDPTAGYGEEITMDDETEMMYEDAESFQDAQRPCPTISNWTSEDSVDMTLPVAPMSVQTSGIASWQPQGQERSQPQASAKVPSPLSFNLAATSDQTQQQSNRTFVPRYQLARRRRKQQRIAESRVRFSRKEPQEPCPCGFRDASKMHDCPLRHV